MIRVVALRERAMLELSSLKMLVSVAWGGEETGQHAEEPHPDTAELESILGRLCDRLRASGQFEVVEEHQADAEGPDLDDEVVPPTLEETEGFNPAQSELHTHLGEQEIVPAVASERQDRNNSTDQEAGATAEVPQQVNLESDRSASGPPLEGSVKEEPVTSSLAAERPARPVSINAVPAQRSAPSVTEVLALGLAGLVTALLCMTPSPPVYRAHNSIYLPSQQTPLANEDTSNLAGAAVQSKQELLRSGKLTEAVAEHLLFQTRGNAMFREDALSRGMRDLGIGGREKILYATLVADTAQHVRVHKLPTEGLYEITCDSWSAQLAVAFCSDLQNAADVRKYRDPQQGAGSAIQILPHWYLIGALGFLSGCLLAMLLGLVGPRRASVASDEVV